MADISSIQNPRIRHMVQLLEKSRLRKSEGLFVAEGVNELRLCHTAGFNIRTVFYEEDVCDRQELESFTGISDAEWISVSPAVMAKIAYRQGVRNAVALAEARYHSADSFSLPENPLLLVAESVEKPGNLGALLRSADASGTDAVIICDPYTDIFNPNVIRSSVGCVFTMPILVMDSESAIAWLKQNRVSILTTFMEEAESIWEKDLNRATALVVGTESSGLSDRWRNIGAANVLVPMKGKVDSLNVSTAASLLMFEAARQRSRG